MLITFFQAIILGLLQGISELFPISSLGHSVIFPSLVGWNINQGDPSFLNFLVATHLATAIVLFCFFWSDWKKIIVGFFKTLGERKISAHNHQGRLAWLVIAGTVPAGLVGLILQKKIALLFASPFLASVFLMLNGGLLFLGEYLRKKAVDKKDSGDAIAKLTFWQSVKVGFFQIIALIPGLSRSGSTLVGGLWVGLSHEDAARFSFLLATPIIGAAALLKIPSLLKSGGTNIEIALAGALAAALAAYFSIKFLMKHFQTKTLKPFAWYCLIAGFLCSLFFVFLA
jgi:undecaprenyl-diphosphatase